MISVVTGTLNRLGLLPSLIDNTVNASEKIELVLVDGGSEDGTQEYIKNLNHSRIKLIEIGERSSYPHFMNIGIENSSHEIICQWNDDVILINSWDEVLSEIEDGIDFYLFDWKEGTMNDIKDKDWLDGTYASHPNKGWCVVDAYDKIGEIVMNYGLYRKKIFREIGMYNKVFNYYYADGDMSRRAHVFGYKHKTLKNIRVCTLQIEKRAMKSPYDEGNYNKYHDLYLNKILDENINFLK